MSIFGANVLGNRDATGTKNRKYTPVETVEILLRNIFLIDVYVHLIKIEFISKITFEYLI